MKTTHVGILMGHSTGLSDSYYQPMERELLNDYLRAVPYLTISEAEELRTDVRDRLRQMEAQFNSMDRLVRLLWVKDTATSAVRAKGGDFTQADYVASEVFDQMDKHSQIANFETYARQSYRVLREILEKA